MNLDERHPKWFGFRRKNHSASPAKYNAPLAKHNLLFSYANFMFACKTKAPLDQISHAHKGSVLTPI